MFNWNTDCKRVRWSMPAAIEVLLRAARGDTQQRYGQAARQRGIAPSNPIGYASRDASHSLSAVGFQHCA